MLRNVTANLIGRIWSVVSVYVFIPAYLAFLGPEAFGLVGFYTTLVSVVAFADLGLTATLNREMARLSVAPIRNVTNVIYSALWNPSMRTSRWHSWS